MLLVANDNELRYILVLPSALLGPLASTFYIFGATQRDLGIKDNDAYMVLVKLVARSPPSPPAFMGSFCDALVLALYDIVLELNERSTILSWHHGQTISDRWSTFLASVREHAGTAQISVLQRPDVAPIVIKPLPKGLVEHARRPCQLPRNGYMASCWDSAVPREGEAELNHVGRLHGYAALRSGAPLSSTRPAPRGKAAGSAQEQNTRSRASR